MDESQDCQQNTESDYYVYMHLTADAKLPFYIGKGRGGRAYSLKGRNPYWNRIYNKHGLIIELIHINLTEKQAFNIEVEEISWAKQYYELTNITDGGEGVTRHEQTRFKKQQIKDFFMTYKRFPTPYNKDEKYLWIWLKDYVRQQSTCYDSVFAEWAISNGYGKRLGEDRSRKSRYPKQFFYNFYANNGRLPRWSIKEERVQYTRLAVLCSPSSRFYDEEFRRWAESVGYGYNRNKIFS